MGNLKLVLGIFLGILIAVVGVCLAVGIGCAINGLTFSQQITEWFGTAKEVATTVETACIK